MSWGEVSKINDNFKKPLNEQMRDMQYKPLRIITATGTFTPEKTGLYKIICVGAGGDGDAAKSSSRQGGAGGGGGGVAIKTLRLLSTKSYSVTVSTTASFAYDSTAVTAGAGATGSIVYEENYVEVAGGTASGGDYNFVGTSGISTKYYDDYLCGTPGSVGLHIDGLMYTPFPEMFVLNTTPMLFPYGRSILGYGGGGNGAGYYDSNSVNGSHTTKGLPAAVIIIPLEMEE